MLNNYKQAFEALDDQFKAECEVLYAEAEGVESSSPAYVAPSINLDGGTWEAHIKNKILANGIEEAPVEETTDETDTATDETATNGTEGTNEADANTADGSGN